MERLVRGVQHFQNTIFPEKRRFFRQFASACRAASAALDDPAAYRNPWAPLRPMHRPAEEKDLPGLKPGVVARVMPHAFPNKKLPGKLARLAAAPQGGKFELRVDLDEGAAEGLVAGMTLRGIGPAFMSGRVVDVAVDPVKMSTWYVAAGSGGVRATSLPRRPESSSTSERSALRKPCCCVAPGVVAICTSIP